MKQSYMIREARESDAAAFLAYTAVNLIISVLGKTVFRSLFKRKPISFVIIKTIHTMLCGVHSIIMKSSQFVPLMQ